VRTKLNVVAKLLRLSCLFAVSSLANAAGPRPADMLLDKSDPLVIRWSVSASKKKLCSETYPIPEAAKHWTNCASGEFSQCGGPVECSCSDADDKLVWYHCKEGDYARCEDDQLCKEGDSD